MSRPKAREVSDEFWKRVEPLIPVRQRLAEQTYARKTGGGRKPKDPRLVFEGIVHALRTGCQWKALPAERYGSASAIHTRFLEWEKAGVFQALWDLGLAEHDELEGIAWRWQGVGPNPTDRGKKGEQAPLAGRRSWRPVVARRVRSPAA